MGEGDQGSGLRYAVHLPGPAPTLAKLVLAQRSAAHGIQEFWLSEDMFFRGAMATAGAVATAHPLATIGIGVVTPYGRHPATAAMDLRVVDDLAGRLIVGLGTGVARRVEDLGEDPSAPLPRLAATVAELRRHLGLLPDDRLWPDAHPTLPVPPIYLAATGERTLALAGRIADGLICTVMSSVAHIRYATERFGNAACDAGRPEHFDVVAYLPICVDDDLSAARQALRPTVAHFVRKWGRIPNLARLFTDWGPLTPAELARLTDTLEDPAARDGAVPDVLVEAMCILGPPQACAAQLAAYRDAGLRAAAFDPGPTGLGNSLADQIGRLDIDKPTTRTRTPNGERQ